MKSPCPAPVGRMRGAAGSPPYMTTLPAPLQPLPPVAEGAAEVSLATECKENISGHASKTTNFPFSDHYGAVA
jgi:hypothetical protein